MANHAVNSILIQWLIHAVKSILIQWPTHVVKLILIQWPSLVVYPSFFVSAWSDLYSKKQSHAFKSRTLCTPARSASTGWLESSCAS